MLGFAQADQN